MPKEFSWWIWLATAGALLAGLVIAPTFLLVAVAISVIQSVIFLRLHRSLTPYPVQIRLAYTALLLLCLLPGLRWLYWLPTIGTFALVCFGYCLLARILSLARGIVTHHSQGNWYNERFWPHQWSVARTTVCHPSTATAAVAISKHASLFCQRIKLTRISDSISTCLNYEKTYLPPLIGRGACRFGNARGETSRTIVQWPRRPASSNHNKITQGAALFRSRHAPVVRLQSQRSHPVVPFRGAP